MKTIAQKLAAKHGTFTTAAGELILLDQPALNHNSRFGDHYAAWATTADNLDDDGDVIDEKREYRVIWEIVRESEDGDASKVCDWHAPIHIVDRRGNDIL